MITIFLLLCYRLCDLCLNVCCLNDFYLFSNFYSGQAANDPVTSTNPLTASNNTILCIDSDVESVHSVPDASPSLSDDNHSEAHLKIQIQPSKRHSRSRSKSPNKSRTRSRYVH